MYSMKLETITCHILVKIALPAQYDFHMYSNIFVQNTVCN